MQAIEPGEQVPSEHTEPALQAESRSAQAWHPSAPQKKPHQEEEAQLDNERMWSTQLQDTYLESARAAA